jgi:hypothetical protein
MIEERVNVIEVKKDLNFMEKFVRYDNIRKVII